MYPISEALCLLPPSAKIRFSTMRLLEELLKTFPNVLLKTCFFHEYNKVLKLLRNHQELMCGEKKSEKVPCVY